MFSYSVLFFRFPVDFSFRSSSLSSPYFFLLISCCIFLGLSFLLFRFLCLFSCLFDHDNRVIWPNCLKSSFFDPLPHHHHHHHYHHTRRANQSWRMFWRVSTEERSSCRALPKFWRWRRRKRNFPFPSGMTGIPSFAIRRIWTRWCRVRRVELINLISSNWQISLNIKDFPL